MHNLLESFLTVLMKCVSGNIPFLFPKFFCIFCPIALLALSTVPILMFSLPWFPFSNPLLGADRTVSQGQFSFSSTHYHLVSSCLSSKTRIALTVSISGNSLCFLPWTGYPTEVGIPSMCSQVMPLALWQDFSLSTQLHNSPCYKPASIAPFFITPKVQNHPV